MNVILIIVFFIAMSLFSLTVFRNIGLAMVINPDALMIVVGGTLVAVFLGFPFKRLKNAAYDVLETFRSKQNEQETAKDIFDLARIYRRADIRGLERRMKGINDRFLKMGVTLLINNQSNKEIRAIMERAMALRVMDYNHSQNVLKTIARLAPSFGLAGTVISLIKMFEHMQSIDSIAPHMAVAMMSTFYGVIISNLFMLPLCAKLEERSIQSEALMHSTIEGIEAINNRDHPLNIEERIFAYGLTGGLSPSGIRSPLEAAASPSSLQRT
ncbi:MAG TPA: MotA/TolQ/ExbB proton channel family protein [Nitrospiria bacterium]|nr:MotA/TolQ/ExbB proton channel family protein [Nitrospiria bacterium]